jgi:pseudomonalisin/xanthomonalisin
MKLSRTFKKLPLAALVLSTLAVSAQAAESWVATSTHAFSPATAQSLTAQAAVHGVAMAATDKMQIAVSLQMRNQKDLDGLTNDIMSGKSRAYLTKAQFMASHAPSAAQVKAVTDHLAKNGFTNIQVAENNLIVTADGTASGVKSAFNTEVHHYTVAGRDAHANMSDAMVPQSLSNIVLAVHGLQNVHMKHTMAKRLDTTTNGLKTLATGHNPKDFSNIYGASSLPVATNATLAIITQGSMTQTITDLKSFASSAGFPAPAVSVITVGATSTDTSGTDEWNLDTQSSLSTAGGQVKSMLLYTSPTLDDAPLNATFNKAVTDNLAKSINVSLGECENDSKTSGSTATEDAIFKVAVAQGQMFSVSSGDSGSAECGAVAGQSAPAVSPYVMAIGGTLLQTSGSTWSSETVWTGGGGGPSLTEARPSWQSSVPLLANATGRGVPDISFDADPNSGALVLVNGVKSQIGGTSLAAPIFAGIWARVQSANGNTLPFPAANLYAKAAANPSMFHDITSGNNGGYKAAAGWDYATGFGSLVASNFAAVIGGTVVTPPPPSNVLTKGVAVTGIALATGASTVYTFAVPAGHTNLTFKLSGGTGDGDIYAKFGSAPTTSTYDAKSNGSTNTETITIAAPKTGTYYVEVYGYKAISGVSLVANYN